MLSGNAGEAWTTTGRSTSGSDAKTYLHATQAVNKHRGTVTGVPIIRTIIYWGLYWDPKEGLGM